MKTHEEVYKDMGGNARGQLTAGGRAGRPHLHAQGASRHACSTRRTTRRRRRGRQGGLCQDPATSSRPHPQRPAVSSPQKSIPRRGTRRLTETCVPMLTRRLGCRIHTRRVGGSVGWQEGPQHRAITGLAARATRCPFCSVPVTLIARRQPSPPWPPPTHP